MADTSDNDDFLIGGDADSLLSALGHQKKPDNANAVKAAIDLIETKMAEEKLTDEDIDRLVNLIPADYLEQIDVGADFDLNAELGIQLKMVNALRSRISTAGGLIKKDVSISEAKAVLDSCRTSGEVIRKNMESVVNLNRIQAIEAAVIETFQGSPEAVKREYLACLTKNLAIFCKE